MKKQMLLFTSLCLLFGFTVVPAYGQTDRVMANVPFKFIISDKTFSAGQYVFFTRQSEVVLENSQGRLVAMVLGSAVSGPAVGATGRVVFRCYADQCFLSQVWSPVREVGRELLMSRSETEVAKR